MREGLRVHSAEAPTAGLMFGKGIYLSDAFSKAIGQCHLNTKSTEPKLGLVFLAEAALGEMHRAHQPEQFPGAPSFSHSVYGVGKYKPCKEGIKDINNVDNNYELTENSKPTERILFNTGRLKQNPDLKEDPQQYENSKGLNYNEFVVYDNAQVKLRYAVLCEFEFQ